MYHEALLIDSSSDSFVQLIFVLYMQVNFRSGWQGVSLLLQFVAYNGLQLVIVQTNHWMGLYRQLNLPKLMLQHGLCI